MISIIVACSENLAIGLQGNIPWHLSGDMKYFKSMTTGKTVIMGRKTYESIGRPLPNRTNIIVTRDSSFEVPEEVKSAMKEGTDVVVCHSLDDAIEISAHSPETIIMGGAQIYNQAWELADRFYITKVHTMVEEFDASIPELPADVTLVSSESHSADEKNDYDYTFEVYDRNRLQQE